jgi:hypothetical protein
MGAFDVPNCLLYFNISYLDKAVNCTEPSPSVSVPWTNFKNFLGTNTLAYPATASVTNKKMFLA